jgi:hypothetical protein
VVKPGVGYEVRFLCAVWTESVCGIMVRVAFKTSPPPRWLPITCPFALGCFS